MGKVLSFLTQTRGKRRLHITDIISYLYLAVGTFIMFGPVLWLVLSSFKSSGEIVKFPPRLLPYKRETAVVEGYDEPLDLYDVTLDDGSTARLAQVRRIGLGSTVSRSDQSWGNH